MTGDCAVGHDGSRSYLIRTLAAHTTNLRSSLTNHNLARCLCDMCKCPYDTPWTTFRDLLTQRSMTVPHSVRGIHVWQITGDRLQPWLLRLVGHGSWRVVCCCDCLFAEVVHCKPQSGADQYASGRARRVLTPSPHARPSLADTRSLHHSNTPSTHTHTYLFCCCRLHSFAGRQQSSDAEHLPTLPTKTVPR